VRILFLAWLAVVLYSNTSLGPVAAFLGVTRIPLMPLAACYNFGTTATFDWAGLLALVLMVVYVIGLTLLGEYWMSRRDLLLQ
jgi:hypothetical protein